MAVDSTVAKLVELLQVQMQQQEKRHEEAMSLVQQQMSSFMDRLAVMHAVPSSTPSPVDVYAALRNDLPEFAFTEDTSTTFTDWYDRHSSTISTRGSSLTEDQRRDIVISKLDQSTYRTYCQHILPDKSSDLSFDQTIVKLKELFGPNKSLCKRRFECFQTSCPPLSRSGVPYRDYANAIKKRFEDAQMKDIDVDTLKCIAYIFGLSDSSHSEVRLRLLNKMNMLKDPAIKPDINEMLDESISWATIRAENRGLDTSEVKAIHRKDKKKKNWNRQPSKEKQDNAQNSSNRGRHESPGKQRSTTPASRNRRHAKHVVAFTAAEDARTYIRVDINGRSAKLQLDTGADITMISRRTWTKIGSPNLQTTSMALKTADGSPMDLLGKFITDFSIYDSSNNVTEGNGPCYVTESTDLIGLEWLIETPQYCSMRREFNCNLVSNIDNIRQDIVADLQDKYQAVFQSGLGHCSKLKAKLYLKPSAQPTYRNKRQIPFASQPIVDAELERLQAEQVISPVDYSSWAAPIVAAKKTNGSIRLCADFSTGLNDSLMLHQHPLPTAEDVFTKLNGGQLFSQIDFADAYLQIEVDESSKELLTINTHRGLFRYNRLPFGVKSAPGIFQQIIDSMIAGLSGVAAYLDDIIVTGSSIDEHRHNLEAILQRIQEYGFRVRLSKCNFFMPQIRYLGHIIDKDGRRPDPAKVRAISEMPPPKDVSQLRSFLGLITYYGHFVSKMRQLRAPLDALLKKDTPFNWSTECQTAFNNAKEVLASPLLLTHYDPNADIVVAADASDYGIGAVISHRYNDGTEKAICHASRSLTPAETKYGQIEKEGLALIFAVRKFHRYIFGRHFTLLTDHKPLLTIFGCKNGLPVYTANRLLRWSLILRAYDFTIEYRKTTDFGQADALSRLIAADDFAQQEDVIIAKATAEADAECRAAAAFLPIKMIDIAKETSHDDTLKDVVTFVRTDKWPNNRNNAVSKLYSQRKSLSVKDDCLFFGHRIIIPCSLRRQVLDLLHDGHPGENRMKTLARQFVFWTNINNDITEFVKKCRNCQEVQKNPVKAELHTWPKEDRPWNRIHIDFAGPFEGKMFLIVVDAFSKWPEIIEMSSTTSTATIHQLTRLFAQFGNPETLVSDNGTQFTSHEFAEFCTALGINHLRSPPFHPQSNGQAERFVDSFKRSMKKIKECETTAEALQKFLLVYRRTPCSSSPGGLSPAENFLGRPLRTTLSLLNTPRSILKNRNEAMENRFNRHNAAKPKSFEPNDIVWAMDFRAGKPKWITGVVLSHIGNTLYDIEMNDTVYRRHANQLRPRRSDDTELLSIDADIVPRIDPTAIEPLNPPAAQQSGELHSSDAVKPVPAVMPIPIVNPVPVKPLNDIPVPVQPPVPAREPRQRRQTVKFAIDPKSKSYN